MSATTLVDISLLNRLTTLPAKGGLLVVLLAIVAACDERKAAVADAPTTRRSPTEGAPDAPCTGLTCIERSGVTLARSTVERDRVEGEVALSLVVTPREILADGRSLVPHDDGEVAPEHLPTDPLNDWIIPVVDRAQQLHDHEAPVIVAPDRSTPYGLVYLTRRSARLSVLHVHLAARGAEDSVVAVEAFAPRGQTRSTPESNWVSLEVGANGFTVADVDKRIPPIEGCPDDGPTICLRQEVDVRSVAARAREASRAGDAAAAEAALRKILDAYRWHELYNLLVQLKEHPPEQRTELRFLAFSAHPEVPWAIALRALDVARFHREEGRYETNDALWKAAPKRGLMGLMGRSELFDQPSL